MQIYSNHLFKPFRMDDEDEPKENGKEEKNADFGMLAKKMEKFFF
jgi:ATP-dependent Clp protease protease subunit